MIYANYNTLDELRDVFEEYYSKKYLLQNVVEYEASEPIGDTSSGTVTEILLGNLYEEEDCGIALRVLSGEFDYDEEDQISVFRNSLFKTFEPEYNYWVYLVIEDDESEKYIVVMFQTMIAQPGCYLFGAQCVRYIDE